MRLDRLRWLIENYLLKYETVTVAAEGRRVRMKSNHSKTGVQVGESFNACGICYTPVLWDDQKNSPVLVSAGALQREEPTWRDVS